MPVPVSWMLMESVVSEVAMEIVPVRVPIWVGVKVICSVQVVFGARELLVGQSPVAV
jgi:hypothetical protein